MEKIILNYRGRAKSKINWRLLTYIGAALLTLLLIFCWLATHPLVVHTRMVCQECGMLRAETQWLGLSWLTTIEDHDTPITETLRANGFPVGTHRFICFGVDGYEMLGRFCSVCVGNAGTVWANARNPQTAVLIAGLYLSGKPADAEHWRQELLDDTTARAGYMEVQLMDVPFEPFASPETFIAWQKEHMPHDP